MSDTVEVSPYPAPDARRLPTLGEALRVWLKVALLSFGGPAGQIATMHRIVVEERRWVSDARFLHALNYCMLLPGPEAQQLATYLGWLMHGARGGAIAGLLFVLPGALAMLGLSLLYVTAGTTPLIAGAFYGLKAAVIAIVLQALLRVGRKALTGLAQVGLAALAFLAIFAFGAPFPAVIAAAALIGFAAVRLGVPGFGAGATAAALDAEDGGVLSPNAPMRGRAPFREAIAPAATALALWLAPVAALTFALGTGNVFADIATFFSQMAVVTFGGAYAALAYVAQQAVEGYGWLRPGEMLDGLGLAETTPGPLILVLQFVGFLAAHRAPGGLDPLFAGALGGLLASWVTFAPSFFWIFLGAPFVERLRDNRLLSGALAGVSAAVVGVILNLALWFALHALFRETGRTTAYGLDLSYPAPASLDVVALALTAGALLFAFRLKVGIVTLLSLMAAAGVVCKLSGIK
ncbi:chromate efflux transporter [Methylopila sp. 73B]|uniref:chromate efflux transporter n=1 Tax=Methylopila sp. 73B TaxID=1120792 RepID=UPI000380E6AA|nr:chromate efflux transporter [Methylopila sp. 73B]